MNRLADETSPYLRQHADNPVDWFPWGEEAFAAARAADRPVLLSVGYSSCHWCHVMAHESFEDDQIAARMNDLFVNVKVDREERPDVDAIYMDAVQALTGRGGWPMTVWLLPDGRPFFAGTYFRPKQFVSLMDRIDEVWNDERGELTTQAAQLTAAVSLSAELLPGDDLPGPEVVDEAIEQLRRAADREHGGFGGAPKFPQTMNLEVLLRRIRATGDADLTEIATTTLDAMASGGMYDHLGGGFARYSVDRRWVVPHFEKMLYDQALLVRAYLHGWQLVGRSEWLQVVEETIGYVLGTLANDEGGLGSAEDADTEGVEGKFYVWTPDEIRTVLGDGEAADAASRWYGVDDGGNFEGRSILVRAIRGDLHRPPEIEAARRRLLDARDQRIRPGLDDKALTEWNALFLSSLCEAAAATGRSDWTDAATAVGTFLVEQLRRDDGRWMRSWQAGRARHLATAADHAALVDALTRLAELTGRRRWIEEALAAADALVELFHDDERGGFFTTGIDADPLITRPKDLVDGATPSATSLAAVGLARLAALTGRSDLAEHARECVRLVADPLAQQPSAFGHLLGAVELLDHGTTEVVVVGEVRDAVETVHRRFDPAVVLAWGESYDSPLWEGRSPGHAYVCRDFSCRLPVTDADALRRQLDEGGADSGRHVT